MPADPRKIAHRILAEHGQRRPEPRVPPIDELADLARDYLRLADPGAAARETLADPVDGVLYVTLGAARSYLAWLEAGDAAAVGARLTAPDRFEVARRQLTERLIDAKQAPDDPTSWRMRSRSTGLDISARVQIEGRLLVVTAVTVRDYNTGGGRRG